MIGDIQEASVWFVPPARKKAENKILEIFDADRAGGLVFSGVEWEVLGASDSRIATSERELPENMKLLVGRARIIAKSDGSFLADLEKKDLKRLRKLTHEKQRKLCPWSRPLTGAEIDSAIEEIGPQCAEAALRDAIKNKVLQ